MRDTELRLLHIAAAVLCSWLGFNLLHGLGQIFHAWYAGGTVSHIAVNSLGVMEVQVFPNPNPRFIAWGGILWGALLPLILLGVGRIWLPRVDYLLAFFACFCLIGTGLTLVFGSVLRRGDAAELVLHGVPGWLLVGFGLLLITVGLSLWQQLAPRFALGDDRTPINQRAVYGLLGVACLLLLALIWLAVS